MKYLKQFLYGFLQISSFLGGVSSLKSLGTFELRKNSKGYFDLAAYAGAFVNQIVTSYVFYKNPTIFCNIFNFCLKYKKDFGVRDKTNSWTQNDFNLKSEADQNISMNYFRRIFSMTVKEHI